MNTPTNTFVPPQVSPLSAPDNISFLSSQPPAPPIEGDNTGGIQTPSASNPTPGLQAQQAPQINAQPPHRNILDSMTHGILNALAGNSDTEYQVDPQTGAITQHQVPSKPGSQWAKILAGALAGAAAGSGQKGPGSVGRSFGAGFGEGEQQDQQRVTQQRQQAVQQSNDIVNAQVRHASFLKSQVDQAKNALDLAAKQQAFTQGQIQNFEAVHNMITSNPNAKFEGQFNNLDSLMNYENRSELVRMHANKELAILPMYDSSGKSLGFQAYSVPKKFMDQVTQEDHQVYFPTTDPKTGKVTYQPHTIKAGSATYGDLIQYGQNSTKGAVTPEDILKEFEADAKNATNENIATLKAQYGLQAGLAKLNAQLQPLSPDQIENQAQMIANYKTSYQEFLRWQRYQKNENNVTAVMNRVMQLNPSWNEHTYQGISGAVKSFSAGGKNQQAVINYGTAMRHLAMLDKLLSSNGIDGQSNWKVANSLARQVGAQFGDSTITDLKTFAAMLSHEVGRQASGGVPDVPFTTALDKVLADPGATVMQVRSALFDMAAMMTSRAEETANQYKQVARYLDPNVAFGTSAAGLDKVVQHFSTRQRPLVNPFSISNYNQTQPYPGSQPQAQAQSQAQPQGQAQGQAQGQGQQQQIGEGTIISNGKQHLIMQGGKWVPYNNGK